MVVKIVVLLYEFFVLWATDFPVETREYNNLVPRVSLLCLHCCLFSTTMEAEKRDPGNEVGEYNSQIVFQSEGHVIFCWCHLFSFLFHLINTRHKSKAHIILYGGIFVDFIVVKLFSPHEHQP